MKITKKKSIAAIAVAGLLSSFALTAEATVLSSSVIQMSNLLFEDGAGNTLVVGDYDNLAGDTTADISANLTSVAGTATNSDNQDILTGSAIDLPFACQGNCSGYTENSFAALSAIPTEHYAIGDQREAGSPIGGIPGNPTPATIESGSYVGLTSTDVGSATSNNGLNTTFSFTGIDTIAFAFDVDAYLEAWVDPVHLLSNPTNASASFNVTWTIEDLTVGGTVFNWAPDGVIGAFTGGTSTLEAFSLNTGLSRDQNFPGQSTIVPGSPGTFLSGSFYAVTNAALLDPTHTYKGTASIKTVADATLTQVPEPNILALLGISVLGFGFVAARRRKGNKFAA